MYNHIVDFMDSNCSTVWILTETLHPAGYHHITLVEKITSSLDMTH